MTTTITLWWGSRLVVPSSGIVLSDGMEDLSVAGAANYFGYEPSPANYIAPGRRPLSSQCPFLVESAEGEFEFAGGAAGGSRILSSNVQTAMNYLVRRFPSVPRPMRTDQPPASNPLAGVRPAAQYVGRSACKLARRKLTTTPSSPSQPTASTPHGCTTSCCRTRRI